MPSGMWGCHNDYNLFYKKICGRGIFYYFGATNVSSSNYFLMKASILNSIKMRNILTCSLLTFCALFIASCSTNNDEPLLPEEQTKPEKPYSPQGHVLDKGGWKFDGRVVYVDKNAKEIPPEVSNDVDKIPDNVNDKVIDNFTTIVVDEENPYFRSVDGVLFNKDMSELIIYPRQKQGDEYVIPATVVTVREYAFANNEYLRKISFEGNYSATPAKFKDHAFYKMNKIQHFTFPADISEMGISCFEGCKFNADFFISKSMTDTSFMSGLANGPAVNITGCSNQNPTFSYKDGFVFDKAETRLICMSAYPKTDSNHNLMIPEGTVSIAGNAFWFRCLSTVSNVILPQSLRKIEKYAFSGSTGMAISIPAAVEIEPNAFNGNTSISKVELSEGFTTVPENAFNKCENLREIKFPKSLKSVGVSAFSNCRNLKSVTLPENLEIIRESAFYNCGNLSEVILPASLKTIERDAFILYLSPVGYTPYHGINFYCHAITPPTINEYSLNANESTLYVPSQSIDLYKKAPYWSEFTQSWSNGIKPLP